MTRAIGCYSCEQEDQFDRLPVRERIAVDRYWRVAHVVATAMPGWLVLVPRRHVTAIADLTDAEAAGLGLWQVRLSRALRNATGCVKTYSIQFAEARGFQHVHFHLVPRPAGLSPQYQGPRIFELLNVPGPQQLSAVAMDELAATLARHLQPT